MNEHKQPIKVVVLKSADSKADALFLAEGEGFEPSLPGVLVKRFSRPPHSAALPSFQIPTVVGSYV